MKEIADKYLYAIKNNWNWWRVVRLVLGIFFTAQTLYMKDYLFALFGVYYTFLALTNTGCCGTTDCSVDRSYTEKETENVVYEEVK